MALNITIEPSGTIEVPEEVAADLLEVYTALAKLPARNQATVDFTDGEDEAANIKAAKQFVRQATSWAAAQEPALKFTRKGDITGNPTRVSFRIADILPDTNEDGTPRTKPGRKPKNAEASAE